MAERQAQNRQSLEMKALNSAARDSLLGLVFGLLIALATVTGGTICILNGYTWSGTIVGVGGVTGLVSVFIYGSKQKPSEQDKGRLRPEDE